MDKNYFTIFHIDMSMQLIKTKNTYYVFASVYLTNA